MSVVVVAHQPQFLPYLGLYNKILQSNKFIFLDDVKFKNSSWHARTIVKNHQELSNYFKKNLVNNELIIGMGAGAISKWMTDLRFSL